MQKIEINYLINCNTCKFEIKFILYSQTPVTTQWLDSDNVVTIIICQQHATAQCSNHAAGIPSEEDCINRGGGYLYYKLDIILVKGLSKHSSCECKKVVSAIAVICRKFAIYAQHSVNPWVSGSWNGSSGDFYIPVTRYCISIG